MHSFKQKTQEFLGILLAIAWELPGYLTYMHFQIRGSYDTAVALSAWLEQIVVWLWEFLRSQFPRGRELLDEIFSQRGTCENALQNRVHETCVPNISQAYWRVAVSFSAREGYFSSWLQWGHKFGTFISPAIFWLLFCVRISSPLSAIFSWVTADIAAFESAVTVFTLFLLEAISPIAASGVSAVGRGLGLLLGVFVVLHEPEGFAAAVWVLLEQRS